MINEIICDQCNGTGFSDPLPENTNPFSFWEFCSKCRGVGKLNWIDRVFGKQQMSIDELNLRNQNRDNYFGFKGFPRVKI
jgi:hypothetical protein